MKARILLASALALLLFLAAHLAHFGWRSSALCDFGSEPLEDVKDSRYKVSAARTFRPGFVIMDGQDRGGYDGQYYFFVACDPLARHTEGGWADPYYWQRILHSALSWILAWGEPGRIPLTMAAVTLLAVLLGSWCLLELGAGAWVLMYALAAGHLYGLQRGVGGPALSLALSLSALLVWKRGRPLFCAVLLAAALLARESAILVVLPLALWAFLEGKRRDALLVLLSLLPLMAWNLHLNSRLGSLGLANSGHHVTFPLFGMLERTLALKGSGVDFSASGRGLANNAVLLAFLAYGLWTAVDACRNLLRKGPSLWSLLYLGHALFFCCLTKGQLVDLNGATRPFLPVLPFLLLARGGDKGRGDWSLWILLTGSFLLSAAVAVKTALAHPEFHVL